MGISLAGIGQKLGFHPWSWVIYQAGIGQKDEIVGKWSIHRKIICAPKNKFEDTVFDMGVHKKPRAWKSYGFATSTWYFNLDWIHYLYEDTRCFTLVGVIIWKSQRKKKKKNPKTSTLVHTPPEYKETIPKDIPSLLNASQDDATSSEVGTLEGPDRNWQPHSSGSALTTCHNEMLFSFECLHPPPWVEEWNLLPQFTVSSCVLFFSLLFCFNSLLWSWDFHYCVVCMLEREHSLLL